MWRELIFLARLRFDFFLFFHLIIDFFIGKVLLLCLTNEMLEIGFSPIDMNRFSSASRKMRERMNNMMKLWKPKNPNKTIHRFLLFRLLRCYLSIFCSSEKEKETPMFDKKNRRIDFDANGIWFQVANNIDNDRQFFLFRLFVHTNTIDVCEAE